MKQLLQKFNSCMPRIQESYGIWISGVDAVLEPLSYIPPYKFEDSEMHDVIRAEGGHTNW